MPIVRSSSPPFSQGLGSASSDTWTHRIALPNEAWPATGRTSRPGVLSRSAMVSGTHELYDSYKGAGGPWLRTEADRGRGLGADSRSHRQPPEGHESPTGTTACHRHPRPTVPRAHGAAALRRSSRGL